MPKTKLSLEDIDQIKKSKNNLSASDVQGRYGIGWNRLQKIWDNNDKQITPAPPEIIHSKPEIITPEDVIYNLKVIAEESRKQTELLSQFLDKQSEILLLLEEEEEEKEQTLTLKDVEETVTEFKTFGYLYAGIMAAISIWLLKRNQAKEEIIKPSLNKKEIDPFEF